MQRLLQAYLDSQGYRLSKTTISRFRHNVNRWLKVRADSADGFRKILYGKLSPTSIEDTISDIGFLHRWSKLEFEVGTRLRRSIKGPHPPSTEDIDKFVSHVEVAKWPVVKNRIDWWRAFVAVACWTGFRLSDIGGLSRENVTQTQIIRRSNKTQLEHVIPTHDSVMAAVVALDSTTGSIFRLTKSRRQIYREFKRICSAAEVPQFRPKNLRQYAINQWSNANSDAGRIIHGCGLGVMRHYLFPFQVLESAASSVVMPSTLFQSDSCQECDLLTAFRSSSQETKDLIIGLISRMK